MTKTLPLKKVKSYKLALATIACLVVSLSWGQQVIGEFPIMDGGFEAQPAGTMGNAGSNQAGTAQTEWTVSSSSRAAIREIENDASKARSGNYSATMKLLASAGDNIRLQSISTVSPQDMKVSTEYTIQFFYKAAANPGDDLDPGIYLNNTSGGSAGNKTDLTTFVANTYTKTYATRTSADTFNASNWAVARMSGSNETEVTFDDFVVYAGALDETAPDAPTGGTYDVSGNIGWTAPASGIDNGGYVVVKYTTMPNADNDPNQNGIYQVGNTTNNGTGGLSGEIVYVGTSTAFTDTYVAGSYYKVYTVDKAFNYSEELVISDSVLSVDEVFASNFRIYPNPAKDFLNISTLNNVNIESVKLFNLIGKEVYSGDSSTQQINISNLNKGLYLLKIEADSGSLNKKVIVE